MSEKMGSRGGGRIGSYTKDGGKRAEELGALPRFKGKERAPTVAQIEGDTLTTYAKKYWAPHTLKKHEKYNPEIIKEIYKDLKTSDFSVKRIMMLEFSQYLESYLWPNFPTSESETTPSDEHVLSVILIINEKIREKVPPWMSFQVRPEAFPRFFKHVLELSLRPLGDEKELSIRERTNLLLFLDHCFTSMEIEIIRDQQDRKFRE